MYAQKAIVHNAPTLHTVRNVHNAHCAYRFKVQSCDCINFVRAIDPACGSGNFFTETYLSLRRLENEVIREKMGGQMTLVEVHNPIKVSIQQFYGIEINDFAVTVGKIALWIAESQMLEETKNIVYGFDDDFLPLKTYVNITEANALRNDWNDVVPAEKLNYIMGNPPFVGYSSQSKEHKRLFDGCTGDICKESNKYNL